MVQGVEQARDEGYSSQLWIAPCTEHHGSSQAKEDDADILNAVVGQQSLQIVLHERIQNT